MDMRDNHLAQLPEELLLETMKFLDDRTLLNLARTCDWAYQKSIPLLWHDVELVDCRTEHLEMPYHSDEHDDTPIIKKLVVLATNPWIASHVQILTHRCHLPPPALFAELPRTNFQSRFLSSDPRTILWLERACANLANIQTLKIIFGHWFLTKGLLLGVLDKSRKRNKPLRKLWLENCSVPGLSEVQLSKLDLHGLESIRIRRMQLLQNTGIVNRQQVYARGRSSQALQDGSGGLYHTTTDQWTRQEVAFGVVIESTDTMSYEPAYQALQSLYDDAYTYDDMIWNKILKGANDDLAEYANDAWSHKSRLDFHIASYYATTFPLKHALGFDTDPLGTTLDLLKSASGTLTSLNLDWIIIRRIQDGVADDGRKSLNAFRRLFSLRFPCLRAFQLRNSVVKECELPPGLYLLDKCSTAFSRSEDTGAGDVCIDFMEAHPKLRCLAWPMDAFFDSNKEERSDRVIKIIENLSQSLIELRVDAMYDAKGEYLTSSSATDYKSRADRRLFIAEFAAKMRIVEDVKIEGGIPRDERRETIRALGNCPLRKIVLIGVNCPIGNTWGFRGQDVEPLGINEDFSDPDDLETLEFEDIHAVTQFGAEKPSPPSQAFRPEYGWPPSALLIHTLAAHHADTVTELKFCGYRGAPVLWEPLPITISMFSPLRHFHNLKSIVISLWLQTLFEDDYRDEEVISSWLDTRSPSSNALVAPGNVEVAGWARVLRDRFAPHSIASRMKDFIGPYLSERAKARKDGVHVRGSFCVGLYGGIFDFDIKVGKAPNGEDSLFDWVGPREEQHPDRRQEKLNRRRWF